MATLEAGTTLNKFSGDTYLREYLPEKILTKPPGREGGEGARIRNDLQEGKNWCATIRKNPQWFTRWQKLIRCDQQVKLQCEAMLAKGHTRSHAIPRGLPRRSHTEVGEDCWPTRSSLTLPKWYLVTLKRLFWKNMSCKLKLQNKGLY